MAAYWVEEGEPKDMDDAPVWNAGAGQGGQPTVGQELSEGEGRSCRPCCSSLMQDKPGKIYLVEHSIDIVTAPPTHQAPYRLPYTYRETV